MFGIFDLSEEERRRLGIRKHKPKLVDLNDKQVEAQIDTALQKLPRDGDAKESATRRWVRINIGNAQVFVPEGEK